MAGIGFKLQKLLVEEMYLSLFQGFFYALVITSGPWLIMVISLSALMLFSRVLNYDLGLFNFMLVHVFAITIIITGVFQVFFTRVFADQMYMKQRKELPRVIMTNLIITLVITVILIVPFIFFLLPDVTFLIKMLILGLFLTVTIIWVLINYVSASEDFMVFVKHYGIGCLLSIVLGVGLAYSLNGFEMTSKTLNALQEPLFTVSENALNTLQREGVFPDNVMRRLEDVEGITIRGEAQFFDALAATIGEEHVQTYTELLGDVRFTLDESSIQALKKWDVPDEVLESLKGITGQIFAGEDEFWDAVSQQVVEQDGGGEPAQFEWYRDAIMHLARVKYVHEERIPEDILAQLQPLRDEPYTANIVTKLVGAFTFTDPATQNFRTALQKTIGENDTNRYGSRFLKDANNGLYLAGFFCGFLLGQGYIALVLFVKTISIFGFPSSLDFSVFRTFRQYHVFLVSGFFLNAGLWIDKILYSYGPMFFDSLKPVYWEYVRAAYGHGLLNLYTFYTDPFYITYLSTTPILALFFISMETTFYLKYYAYNRAMVSKGRLGFLQKLRDEIRECVNEQLGNIVKFQSLIVVLGILLSATFVSFLNINTTFALSFNIILLGVFFHMMFLIMCITLLYYDLRKETMQIYTGFFILNTALTIVMMALHLEYYLGLGYTISAVVMFAYTFWPLRENLKNINYLSFTRQQMAEEKIEEVFIKGEARGAGAYGRYYIKDGEQVIDA